jgi:phosphotransferase system  glucose/maltose/N-acetylglucosamine-specific IIC component
MALNNDDLIYGCLLVISIIIGILYKKISNKRTQQWTGTLIGVLFVFIMCKWQSIRIFVYFLSSCAIMKTGFS